MVGTSEALPGSKPLIRCPTCRATFLSCAAYWISAARARIGCRRLRLRIGASSRVGRIRIGIIEFAHGRRIVARGFDLLVRDVCEDAGDLARLLELLQRGALGDQAL